MTIVNETNIQFLIRDEAALLLGDANDFLSYLEIKKKITKLAKEKIIMDPICFVEYSSISANTFYILEDFIKKYPNYHLISDIKKNKIRFWVA
ncbi:MAG: hypothetical protein A3F40_02160 [Chlamydiae bacterium RIFCSPHIGHO2_12_FULL_27_8]|nr:MAG: hypothetical protein A3F40_02160 [Chlamydiae bacterium RIFCSPHIGHO2_12_FULL_27_8]